MTTIRGKIQNIVKEIPTGINKQNKYTFSYMISVISGRFHSSSFDHMR